MAAGTREPTGWKPIALDGGYGCLVVLGSFLIQIFSRGFAYSFAQRSYVELDVTYTELSTALSLLTVLIFATGPVAAAICNRIGCRLTTIIGAIIASFGCATSYYATSMIYIIGSLGIIMGTGFGLMYCSAIIIVTMYFEKYRLLATGITVCGAVIGIKLSFLVITMLFVNFKWERVFLIYAGILLLCIPCGLLYRPVEFAPIYDEEEKTQTNELKLLPIVAEEEAEKLPSTDGQIYAAFSHTAVSLDPEADKSNLQRHQSLTDDIAAIKPRSDTVTERSGYWNIKDVLYSGFVTALKKFQNDAEHFRSVSSLDSDIQSTKEKKYPKLLSLRENNEENFDSQAICASESRVIEIWARIVKIFDLRLFTDPVFVLFAVSNFLTSISFGAPHMYIPIKAEQILGSSKYSIMQTLYAYGWANIVGQLVFGLVCDYKLPFKYGKDTARNRLWIYNWTLMLAGISSCFIFAVDNYYAFNSYYGIFGFLISSYLCLKSVVLVDIIGIDRFTSAFGLLLFVQGIAIIVGPRIAEALYNITENYDLTFAFSGICLFISGIMLFAVPFLQKKKSKEIRLENGKEKQTKALLH